jgi:hypothetical protein
MSNVAESSKVIFEPNLKDWVQKFLEENTVAQRQWDGHPKYTTYMDCLPAYPQGILPSGVT